MRRTPDAVVLCGGAGLRLRSVTGDIPKSMANVAGRPFLELLLRQLARYGCSRVILAVGYRGDLIRAHFGATAFGMQVLYSEEATPLGTGGALRNAIDLIDSAAALVLNGDSYTGADLGAFIDDYYQSGVDASMLIASADGRDDHGSVFIGEGGKLAYFKEKEGASPAPYLNAGVYLLSRRLICELPAGVEISLEKEIFPKWLNEGCVIRAFVSPGECIDIGTPERYRTAQEALATAEADTLQCGSRP